jgi:FkbH-like protein
MKSHNVRKIAAELNLESKDFLFLDDRAEERAMMVEAMPEILTSDSDSPAMWRRLALVAELLARQGQEDRTALYQQRSRREAALAIPVEDAEDRIAMFRKLEFLVRPRAAGKNDLSRVVDLINRTNQFNMCDTRTTLAEAKRWLEGPAHRILVVDALDKFGSMGTVCVAVLVKSGSCLDIAAFVLSSRVFGFGVETALLNTVKRMAGYSSGENATSGGSFAPSQALVVRGGYVGTAANEPCRNVYQDHGFRREGDIWAYHGGGPIVDPEWLTVFAEPLEQLAIRF